MNSKLLYISNLIVQFLPSSRCFALKRFLYRVSGVEVGSRVKLMGIQIFKSGGLIIRDDTFIGNNTYLTGERKLFILAIIVTFHQM